MAFTVDDFPDLLRLLEQHPEWRAELRRQVLTDELLALPDLMRQLTERMDALTERVDALAQAQERTEHLLDEMALRLDEMALRLDAVALRLDEVAHHLGELAQQMSALTTQVSTITGRVGDMQGQLFEIQFRNKYAGRLMRVARGLRLLDQHEVGSLLEQAHRSGVVSEDEMQEVLLADLVLTGRRRQDETDVYLAVEVSMAVDTHDVRRAIDRALVLERLGKPALAVVAGEWIEAEAMAMARAFGVWQVLDGRAQAPDGTGG